MSHNHTHFASRIVIATAVVAMGLVMAPSGAHASTGVTATASTSAKTAPGQPAFGDKGPHVVAVQTAIMRNGFTLTGGATGVFNKATKRALTSFQKVVGLKATGVVDTATAKVLKVAAASTTTVQATTTTVAATTTTVAATTTTTPTVVYPLTTSTLPVRGAKGDAVIAVQKALKAAGLDVKGGIDGAFGSGTTSTISLFQTNKGLTATGVLDIPTAVALALIAPVAAPAPAAVSVASTSSLLNPSSLPVRGNRGDSVRTLQNALIKAGIEVKGGADGVFGGATYVALQKYQTANGLSVTGTLTTQTAVKLSLVAAPAVSISVFPVQGLCSYENTWHAPRGIERLHLGVDILAKEGNLLYAVADGTITKVYTVGTDKLAGNGVRLTMADGTYFFYGHMQKIADGISVGTKVKAGQVVGYNGKTGATNTPHLHIEVHPLGGAAIDPTPIMAAVDACSVTAPLPVPAA
ncbi:MAG: peptidoglycan-binding protein [Ilumatobacteraceae bacterium]|nr:peptidoglycan-binding protein [Ilumatobacteraceae bacterium]